MIIDVAVVMRLLFVILLAVTSRERLTGVRQGAQHHTSMIGHEIKSEVDWEKWQSS